MDWNILFELGNLNFFKLFASHDTIYTFSVDDETDLVYYILANEKKFSKSQTDHSLQEERA